MKILVLDSSSSTSSVAIGTDEKLLAESLFNSDRNLSARLIPEIERILAQSGIAMSDIDLFAASTGPGSFTGVRGGLATLQGLALATGRSCAGFSSLQLLSMNFPLSPLPVCPLLDARKSEVYAALYDCLTPVPAPVLGDCVMPPGSFLELICSATDSPVIFVGEGAERYRGIILERMGDRAVFASFPLNVARASNGLLLALEIFNRKEIVEPSLLLPVYLRASEAEINKARIKCF